MYRSRAQVRSDQRYARARPLLGLRVSRSIYHSIARYTGKDRPFAHKYQLLEASLLKMFAHLEEPNAPQHRARRAQLDRRIGKDARLD